MGSGRYVSPAKFDNPQTEVEQAALLGFQGSRISILGASIIGMEHKGFFNA